MAEILRHTRSLLTALQNSHYAFAGGYVELQRKDFDTVIKTALSKQQIQPALATPATALHTLSR